MSASRERFEPFEAVLYPNPPLSTLGLVLLIGFILLLTVPSATFFLLIGAWPVTGFFGLEVAMLLTALLVARRRARTYEVVRLDPSGLYVERIEAGGRIRRWRLEPYWTRVEIDQPPRPDSPLWLQSLNQRLQIGAFLTPEERLAFAQALKRALARMRTAFL